ncbi:ribonuclease HIII [Streptococcus pasteurianus]
MNTIVMKMGKDDLQNLIKALTSQQVNNNNPYVTFAAKVKGVTVLVYTSGKVVFQGANAETIAEQFGYQSASQSTSDTVSGQNIPLIGSDEVGNGSYFGGLAVVASFVTPDDHALLKKLGVDDSKNLTDSKIRQIAPILENNIKHKALLLSPQKYNQVVGKGKMHNAVSVKVALHNQAIYLLLQDGVKPEKIVIDAFTSRQNYQKYLKNEANQFANPLTLEEKAEGKYLAVAVSSIIARNLFLENLDKLSQEVQYKLPSGAGSQSDKVASQILTAYGMSGLEHTAKLHFANTQKAQALLKKQK